MISTIVEIEHISDFAEQGFNSHSYLANDKRLSRKVAVKDIIYENLTSESDFEKHFEEAYKLSLAAHPRVLPVHYVGLDRSESQVIPRIVSSYFSNGSLNALLLKIANQNKSICLDDAIRFAHDIIQGMIHLHSLDIVHMDLKAANIFIGDDGKLVIADFGHTKFIKDGIIKEVSNIYPAIAPKEVTKKKAADKTIDIYQFGMLLYSIFCYSHYRNAIENEYKIDTKTLKTIFREKHENAKEMKQEFNKNLNRYMKDIQEAKFPNQDSYPIFVPKEIKEIIHKCLDPNIENRYNNFLQIQSDLNNFIFPKGVNSLYYDYSSNSIHFQKEDKPCILKVVETSGIYEVKSTKNGRIVNDCCKTKVSATKITKELFKLATLI